MMYDLARTERQHRAIAEETAPLSHARKACACGARVTAKQLQQHGKCEYCRLTEGLQDGDLDKLRHMLGATSHHPKKQWGFRNHYLCGKQDREAMERLVAAGLAERGAVQLTSQYYHATKDGCRAAGLDRAGIVRALEGQL